ncbi:MAG: hypothetical protein NVSMB27_37860 [Ktedonobacteraceae bacterium]
MVPVYRLALSRLAARLRQRLLVLINAFFSIIVLVVTRIHYGMRFVKHDFVRFT